MATTMSDGDRRSHVAALERAMRASLPYNHPMHYRVSGGALRETQQRAAQSRKALARAGLLEAAIVEAEALILADTREHHQRTIEMLEKEIVKQETELASLRERLEKARARAAALEASQEARGES